MNKHSIILPMLITSAVSLHVLSFYLEEPEEFADVPTPISSSLETANPDQSIVPVDQNTTTTVDVNVQNSSTPETQPSTQVAQASPEAAQVQETPASTTSVTTTTTTTTDTGSGVQVAAALIPTKNYNDMLREAKQIGGRVDPFLSMKPPEIEKVPEIPEPSVNPEPVITRPNTVINKPGYTGTRVIPNPPTPSTWIPSFDNSGTTNIRPTSRPTAIASIQKNNSNNTKPTVVKPTSKPPTVIITPVAKIDDGLELTGIITGFKPLALIKVDSESKVYKVGDIIRKEGRIKLVSIDFDNETVTISDANNKKARLSIK